MPDKPTTTNNARQDYPIFDPDPVPRVRIEGTVATRQDLYDGLAAAVYEPGRAAPRNLDAMAELLEEFEVTEVIYADYRLAGSDARAIDAVFADLGVTAKRESTKRGSVK